MACYVPLFGYRSRTVGASGKRAIVFKLQDGYADLPVTLPCGRCIGCKLEHSRQWAVRCMHEASLYEDNCFLTLTLADEFIPPSGSLDKSEFQRFMKRLRKRFPRQEGNKIRYFHCGEYGEKFGRPHYHVLLFNFDFADKYVWTMSKGFPLYRSKVLEELWSENGKQLGNCHVGAVTFESAAYVSRYVVKKVTGELAKEHYEVVVEETGEVVDRVPEYTTMSRRPGIGQPWLDKFMADVFPFDSVVMQGHEMKPPRYYLGKYELQDAEGALEIARERRRNRREEDESPERLMVREKVTRARLALSSGRSVNGEA